jgi:hypothetical protein
MKYDDASWHYGGDFPSNLNEEAGGTHIGMFVAWCLLNGLAGEIHTDEFPEGLESLRNREETPGQWFLNSCDEKFTDEDLNETGNAFAQYYYAADNAPFLSVYEMTLGQNVSHLYAVPDTWESYDKLAPKLNEGFTQWSSHD